MQPGQEGPRPNATQGEKPGQGPQTPGPAQVCDCPGRLRFTLKSPRTRLWSKPQCREPRHRDGQNPPPLHPAMSRVPAKVARPRGAVRSPWGPNQHVLTACPPAPWCSDPGSQNPSCPPLPPPAPHPDSSQRPPPSPPPAAWDTPFSPALGPHLTTPALGRSAPSRHGTASSSRGPHPQEPPQPRAHITHQDSQEPGLSMSPPAPAYRPPDSPSHHVHWAGKLLTFSQASALTPSRPAIS